MRLKNLLLGLGIGSALMYLFDRDSGNSRRARLRDQLRSLRNQARETTGDRAKDLRQRTSGLMHEARARMRQSTVSDAELVERVRAELGHVVRHAGAIRVTAQNGNVVLAGPALANEVDNLLTAAEHVRGVQSVENRLEVHNTPGNIPALQG